MPDRATGKAYPSRSATGESSAAVGRLDPVSAPVGQATPTLWEVYDHWLRRATAIIAESADALNAMNVFPVSDSDTGSNLKLTLAGIAQAVPDVNRASLDAIVQAAILSAHGNSGAIVAEMFTSVCRALEQRQAQLRSAPAGELVAVLLRTVADAARRAVARPVAGTILTVADAAADAAEEALPDQLADALGVARRGPARRRGRRWPVRRSSWRCWPRPGWWTPAARRTCCCSTCWSRCWAASRPSR